MLGASDFVGLDKSWEKPIEGSTWNNAVLRWVILYKAEGYPKEYEIQLQMTYLSSKRVVRVNSVEKHTTMTTFGYESDFDICEGLHGKIKQLGLNFQYELFVNGKSFTSLQQQRPTYMPLQIKQSQQLNNSPFPPSKKQYIITQQKYEEQSIQGLCKPSNQKKQLNNPIQFETNSQKQFVPKQREETEEQKIKRTQKELMLILKQKKMEEKPTS